MKKTRRNDTELGAAIQDAAGKLPEDWQLCITIMRHGYSVGLLDPFGNDYELTAEESLIDDIHNAVAQATAADDQQ